MSVCDHSVQIDEMKSLLKKYSAAFEPFHTTFAFF